MANESISNKLWSACNKMRQDPGTTGSLQYIEQFSWLLFLKVYEEIENEHEAKASFENKKYSRNIDDEFRWSVWTGKDKYLTGPDLLEFVKTELIPHLRKLSGNHTKEIIAEIFNNTQNRMEDGYLLREVIDIIADVDFFGSEDSFAVSNIYEGLFSRMKSAELKPLAEFYTPRVIARFMTEMVAPKIGQTVYDPANGPSGFLVESFDFMKPKAKSVADYEKLHKKTFYGKEVKAFPFILGMMNMILNGISEPNIYKGNTLATNLFNLTDKDKHDIILTNPPFSGSLKGVSSNFPYPSAATEILFLQHAMRTLKQRGKCAIIFPEGVMFENQDTAYVNTKKELLQNYNLHHVIRLPKGSFAPYTPIRTNILFFDKTGPTKTTLFYEMPITDGRKNFTKTKPISSKDFESVKEVWDSKETTENSWIVPIEEIERKNYSLDFWHPNKNHVTDFPEITELQKLISEQGEEIIKSFGNYKKDLSKTFACDYTEIKLGDMLKRIKQKVVIRDNEKYKRVTVKMHGKGIIERDEVLGSAIGTKTQFTISGGQLLMSKIDARNSAFGIVPDELEGAIITGNFWAYDVNKSLVRPEFFQYLTQTNKFKEFCIKSSRGATNRKYLEESVFLAQTITIPKDTAVQDKIVEHAKKVMKESKDLLVKSEQYKNNIELIPASFLEFIFLKNK